MDNGKRCLMWLGIVLIIITGAIHVIEAGEAFEEAAYKGWLFYANGLGSLFAAYGIFKRQCWGWGLGFVITVGSIVGYIFSRTIGLPGILPEPDEWLEPLGVASLLAEGLFTAIVFAKGCGKRDCC